MSLNCMIYELYLNKVIFKKERGPFDSSYLWMARLRIIYFFVQFSTKGKYYFSNQLRRKLFFKILLKQVPAVFSSSTKLIKLTPLQESNTH